MTNRTNNNWLDGATTVIELPPRDHVERVFCRPMEDLTLFVQVEKACCDEPLVLSDEGKLGVNDGEGRTY